MTDTPTRAYRSELRQRQATETRHRVVEAAVEVFSAEGYASATLAKIASRAGVAIETVQKQGSKADLLRAASEYSSFGVEGSRDILELDVGKALLALDSVEQVPDFAAAALSSINSRGAGLWVALTSGANGDAELARYRAEVLAGIREQDARVLGILSDQGWLRTDIEFDDVLETFCVFSSVESYLRFVRHDGKSLDDYKVFIARMMRETILAVERP
ncbi:helix-turn-helix domain-containing protein [Humibacter soli]